MKSYILRHKFTWLTPSFKVKKIAKTEGYFKLVKSYILDPKSLIQLTPGSNPASSKPAPGYISF